MVTKIKKEQIIVRLTPQIKQELQDVADELDVDMSKLIRDKIDEIIIEHKRKKENKLVFNRYGEFLKENHDALSKRIITDELINETKEEFKKMMIDKMNRELGDIDFRELYKDVLPKKNNK